MIFIYNFHFFLLNALFFKDFFEKSSVFHKCFIILFINISHINDNLEIFMFSKRKLLVLLLFSIVLISSVSAISAADANATDVQTADEENVELEQVDSNQDVLSASYSFSTLNDLINGSTSSEIQLEDDYEFRTSNDDNSLTVDRDNVVIDGKGHTIKGSTNTRNPAYGFYVTSKNVVIKNINFVNLGSSYKNKDGGAISSSSLLNNLTVINCTFNNCWGEWGGAISHVSRVDNCTFDYCYGDMGGAIYSSSSVKNSKFTNCNALEGGAVYSCTAVNCIFTNNNGGLGGAGRNSGFINCTFDGNSASDGGAVYQYFSNNEIFNCTFINNHASGSGGALYSPFSYYYVINSTFENNTAYNYAVSYRAHLVLCSFKNNTADDGPPYESGAIGKPTLYSPVSLYSFTCPDQVEIPINYAFKWGTGQNDYFKYKGEIYLFNGINTTLELCEGYSSTAIATCSILSGSSFIVDLGKGDYNLRARQPGEYSSKTYYIHVYGEKTSINAETNTEMYIGEDKHLVVNLTGSKNNPLVGFNISLKENGNVLDILTTDSNGQVSFSLKNLTFGNHDLYLEFSEDARHEASSLQVTVDVKKFDTIIKADDISAFASEDIRLPVNLTDYNNNPMVGYSVYLKENGNVLDKLTTDGAGQVTFSLNNLSEGSHSLSVEFSEDDAYSSSSAQVNVVINRFSTVIKADNVDAFVSDDLSLLVNLTDDENAPMAGYVVYLKENGNVLDNLTTNSSGQVSFSLSDISAGSHILSVEFSGNRIYEGSAAQVTVAIDKYNSVIKAQDVEGYTYQDINLIVNLTDGDNKVMAGYVVYLKENGVVLDNLTTDDNGQVSFLLNGLSEGSHVLYVEFMETRFYRGSSMQVSAVINKFNSVIKADDITAYAIEDINLLVNLTDGDNKPMAGCVVYLKENGAVIANLTTDNAGQVRFSLNGLSAGRHNLYVEYLESMLYKGSSKQVLVVINRMASSISADNIVAYAIDDIKLIVNLTYGGNAAIGGAVVYLKENGAVIANLTTDKSGQVIFSLNDLPAGSHMLYIEFTGNRCFESSGKSVSVVINRVNTIIRAADVVAFRNEGKVIANLTDQWGNPLSDAQVYLNLAYFKNRMLTPIGNGQYEFTFNGLTIGNFSGKVTFNENGTHNPSTADFSLEVLDRLNSNISADNITVFYEEYGILTAYLKDANGNPIENADVNLFVNAKRNTLKTDAEGKVNFYLSLFKLPVGSFDAVVSFDLTNHYFSSSVHVNITVNKIPTKITAPDVTCTYGDGEYLVATLKDKNGRPLGGKEILVKINSRSISQGTDEYGQAKLVVNLVPGNYTAEVCFDGTNFYDSSSATLNITVKENSGGQIIPNPSDDNVTVDNGTSGNQSSVIPVDNGTSGNPSGQTPVDNGTSGNQKPAETTVPTASDNPGEYVVVTLKDDSGNLLVNEDVIIELDGQSKHYKTNGNGQVKVYTESLVPKTYKAKVTVLGENKTSSFNIHIAVKKAKAKIVAKKKKFKAKKKVKKYAIYLKAGQKPIKNARVTLKIKGKTYKAKTNKKGRAVFKLKKLTKKRTYKATITYKGDKWYDKATKKVKIIVR